MRLRWRTWLVTHWLAAGGVECQARVVAYRLLLGV